MKVWKDYTIEDVMVILEKAVKAIKPETVNSCWRKLCPDVLRDVTGLMIEPIEEIIKEIVDMTKKGGGVREGFQDMDLGETQELIDTTTRGINRRPLDEDECFQTR